MIHISRILFIFAIGKTKVKAKAATKVQRKVETNKKKGKKVIMCKTEAAGIQIPETRHERERRERNEAICKDWQEQLPGVLAQGYKPYRLMEVLATKYGMTRPGIQWVLQAAGIYTNAKDCVESIQNTEAEHAQQENE